jgi:Zn-dependent protease with chaperone function
VLYALSVAAIVACVNVVVVLTLKLFSYPLPQHLYLIASLVTLGIIALGTVEILARLSLSEHALAAMLAGRPVNRGSGRDDERRLINIVDEMSIASGLTAPPLFVLNRERGINAFAAGMSPSQAVVVVTQGAIEQLSRDELQAVIAHEFSHILNGDIRINLRAVYVLQGIVFLSAIGRFMMQYYSGAGTAEGRRFFHLPLALAGVGVFAIGSIGFFFCRLIQAAISRERENLADASAVQFTRNADALCGALARIRMHDEGSRVRNWHGDALAHMLFAPNAGGLLRLLFATHPPIEERMRRINPHVSPQFYFEKAKKPRAVEADRQAGTVEKPPEQEKPKTIIPKRATEVAVLVAAIGAPQPEHLEYASGLLAYLVAPLREALRDGVGARAVMLGCVLEQDLTSRTPQLKAIESHAGPELARKAEVLAPYLWKLDRAYRLPLIALASPTLKALPEAERDAFLAVLRATIEADRRLTLSEFVLATILDWTLGPKAQRAGKARHASREAVAAEVAMALSLLSRAGNAEAAGAEAAFAHGRETLAMPGLVLAPLESLQLGKVSAALETLSGLVPEEKEKLLQGFAAAIAQDGNIRMMEHELLRAVACVLDCPMPPSVAALDPRLLRK